MIRFWKIPLLVALLFFVSELFANPVVYDSFIYGFDKRAWVRRHVLIATVSFVPAMLIELGYLRWRLKRDFSPKMAWSYLLLNIFTYPLTQLLGNWLSVLAEILPLTSEPFAMAKLFPGQDRKLLKRHVLMANILSFTVGILAYFVVKQFWALPSYGG